MMLRSTLVLSQICHLVIGSVNRQAATIDGRYLSAISVCSVALSWELRLSILIFAARVLTRSKILLQGWPGFAPTKA